MQRADSLEKDPDAGKDWGQEKGAAEDEMVRGITDSVDMNLHKLWEAVKGAWGPWVLWFTGSQKVRHDLLAEQQQQNKV